MATFLSGTDSLTRELLFAKTRIGDGLTVEALLAEGVDTELQDESGNTALHTAACAGHTQVVITLLSYNACTYVKNVTGMTSLYGASLNGHVITAKRLVEGSDDREYIVNEPNDDGITPLLAASKEGHDAMVEYLISLPETRLDTADHCGRTALHAAASRGDRSIALMLIQAGANPRTCDEKKNTPLMSATLRQLNDVIEAMITHGADVNVVSHDGSTALLKAVRMDYIPTTQILVKAGAELDINDHMTPVMWAAYYGRLTMTQTLIQAGCDVTVTDQRGRTLLHYAASFGWTDVVKILLNKGLDVNLAIGNSPVVLAVRNNHYDVVKLLLDCNCRVDGLEYIEGRPQSLLTLAVARGRRDMCELLYKAGCKLDRSSISQMIRDVHPLHPSGVPDLAWVDQVLQSPHTLVNASRVIVRRQMGRDMRRQVERLPVPKPVQWFILLDDLTPVTST